MLCIRTFPGDRAQVADARAFVAHVARDHPRVDDAQLIVSELGTNAVLHGRAPFCVVVEHLSGGRLRISVLSGATDTCPQVGPPAATEGGRGLTIVAGLANWWDVVHLAGGHWVTAMLDDIPPELPECPDVLTAYADLEDG